MRLSDPAGDTPVTDEIAENRLLATSNLVSLVGKAIGCVLGFYFAGLPGFIVGMAIGTLASHLVLVSALRARQIDIVAQDLRFTLVGVSLAAVGIGAPRFAAFLFTEAQIRHVLELIAAAAILLPFGVRVFRQLRREVVGGHG